MIEEITLITEAEFAPRGKRTRDLFVGRFNPFHSGHSAIVKMMTNNPLIVIVKGKKTSEDRKKNPFEEKYQEKMVKMVYPHAEVSVSPNAFLAGICGFYRKKGDEITRIFAGPDRIDSYRKSIEETNSKMDPEYHYKIEFVETPRVTSATKVRQTLKDDDFDEFKKNMPKELWGEFKQMRETYLKANEDYERNILSFTRWLAEEGEHTAAITTSVGSIDMSDSSKSKYSYDLPWLYHEREQGIRDMLGFDKNSKSGDKFEFDTEDDIDNNDVKRIKNQFFM